MLSYNIAFCQSELETHENEIPKAIYVFDVADF